MTMSIFDDEFIQKAHDDRIYKDAQDAKMNEMAQKMIEEGFPADTIASISGLTIDEVNALRASMALSGTKA